MTRYGKSLALFFAFVVLFELLVMAAGTIVRPGWDLWSDETRLVATVENFGGEIDLEKLRHYHQMSPPLPFIIYALWGRLFGFELVTLRILSVLIAVITYLVFHRLLFKISDDGKIAFWSGALLVVQPYMIGLSIFVYTDMLTILFVLLCLWAFTRRRAFWMGLSLAMAVLTRQYAAFLTLALVIFFALEYGRAKRADTFRMLMAGLIAMLPYAVLVIFWGGLSPAFDARGRLLDGQLYFHPPTLTLYISLIFIYIFPMLVWKRKEFYRCGSRWLFAAAGSVYFLIFPIEPSVSSVAANIMTVGLFHRAMLILWDNYWFAQAVFYSAFLLAMPAVVAVVTDLVRRMRSASIDPALLLDLAILSFLFVMPFSYLGWEKYFMPVLPLVILRLVSSGEQSLWPAWSNS